METLSGARWLSPSPGWGALDWSPDDSTVLVVNEVSINQSHLFVMNAAGGERVEITPPQDKGEVAWNGGVFSKDGKGVYTATDMGGEFTRLAYIDLSSKRLSSSLQTKLSNVDLSRIFSLVLPAGSVRVSGKGVR